MDYLDRGLVGGGFDCGISLLAERDLEAFGTELRPSAEEFQQRIFHSSECLSLVHRHRVTGLQTLRLDQQFRQNTAAVGQDIDEFHQLLALRFGGLNELDPHADVRVHQLSWTE